MNLYYSHQRTCMTLWTRGSFRTNAELINQFLLFYRSVENEKQKCHEYWNDNSEVSVIMEDREIRVNVLEVAKLEEGLIRRTIEIKRLDAKKIYFPCFLNH